MDAKALDTITHLREIEVADLIKETGLYTPILINTFSDKVSYSLPRNPIEISEDVKRLYALLSMNEPVYLPCSNCKKELAFNQIHNIDTKKKPWALGLV